MSARHDRFAVTGLTAIAALVFSAFPAAAQDEENPLANLSEEDMAKAQAFVEFVENADEWLGTVNLIDPESLPVTFPFSDVLTHASVEVAYDGGEPLQFLFDTGAPTIVTEEVAEAYGGEVLVETLNQAGGGIIFFTPLQEYPTMTVGGALDIETPTGQVPWTAEGEFQCFAPDGLLGATAMSNAVWQIDYGTSEITVAASVDDLDHIESAIAVPFIPPAGLSPTPHIQIGVGDSVIDVIVDTGGGVPLTIGTGDIAAAGIELSEDTPMTTGVGFGAGGIFEVRGGFTELPITFGDTELVVPVSVADGMSPGAGGNAGHAFLENFVVTFDWSTNMMYLDPLSEDGIPPFDDPPAVGILWNDGGPVVASMPDSSPALEAGLTLGEPITAIDGESVEGWTIEDYCAFKTSEAEVQTVTTATGEYDASVMEGFFTAKD